VLILIGSDCRFFFFLWGDGAERIKYWSLGEDNGTEMVFMMKRAMGHWWR
jgi:hypothetical protein